MAIKTGGYQSGRTYRWYRSMGHNPISAASMLVTAEMLLVAFMVLIGFVIGFSGVLL